MESPMGYVSPSGEWIIVLRPALAIVAAFVKLQSHSIAFPDSIFSQNN
jgi:hypothetical protein